VPLWGFTYRLLTEWLGLHAACAPPEKPGFQAAQFLLDLLLAHGMELRHRWREESGQTKLVRSAGVKGEIPVAAVLATLALPADRIPPLSSLEIHPDSIRVLGLDQEEYLIQAER
jgi:hypothetical protein